MMMQVIFKLKGNQIISCPLDTHYENCPLDKDIT